MQWADRLIKERRGRESPTSAALWAPHSELATCVRAYVTRSTLGSHLAEIDRRNHFPAAPTCAITWFIQGDYAHLDLSGTPVYRDLPRTTLTVSVSLKTFCCHGGARSIRRGYPRGPLSSIGHVSWKVAQQYMAKGEASVRLTGVSRIGRDCRFANCVAWAVLKAPCCRPVMLWRPIS